MAKRIAPARAFVVRPTVAGQLLTESDQRLLDAPFYDRWGIEEVHRPFMASEREAVLATIRAANGKLSTAVIVSEEAITSPTPPNVEREQIACVAMSPFRLTADPELVEQLRQYRQLLKKMQMTENKPFSPILAARNQNERGNIGFFSYLTTYILCDNRVWHKNCRAISCKKDFSHLGGVGRLGGVLLSAVRPSEVYDLSSSVGRAAFAFYRPTAGRAVSAETAEPRDATRSARGGALRRIIGAVGFLSPRSAQAADAMAYDQHGGATSVAPQADAFDILGGRAWPRIARAPFLFPSTKNQRRHYVH